MHIQARRIFRLSSVLALSLAAAYGLGLPLPFLAPLFALILTAAPAPPMAGKKLLELIIVILITLGIGLAIIPLIQHYPLVAVLVVALGLYFSFYLTVNQNKTMLGTFLTLGLTMISAAGSVSFALALTVIISLVIGIVVAVACNWLIYPLFPEDTAPAGMPDNSNAEQSNWIALRGMLIVLPVYLLVLTNPLAYLAITMKSVALAQQSSVMDAKTAGRELLGSTFLGGMFAILFWMLLGISTNLWMYSLWMLLFGIYFSSKIYQLLSSRYPASFWLNVVMTLLIVLGPAVEDSANGKDVYAAFWGRMGLYVAVTLYAWAAVYLLEHLRTRRNQLPTPTTNLETAL
ncbi:MAG: DUF2955 domain-containing protein [Pseudomonadales bacterium]|nr:DUF2955 domain-containing protein [Pseudomonadales bacterium]